MKKTRSMIATLGMGILSVALAVFTNGCSCFFPCEKTESETPAVPVKAEQEKKACPKQQTVKKETEKTVNAEFLSKCKKTAFIINTSRGPVVDENALADALNSGKIAGAGVDVLSTEPPAKDNPLLTAKNCFITPHIAWAAFETRERLMGIFKSNIEAFVSGKPINVVNP